jgi:hypothetical protein
MQVGSAFNRISGFPGIANDPAAVNFHFIAFAFNKAPEVSIPSSFTALQENIVNFIAKPALRCEYLRLNFRTNLLSGFYEKKRISLEEKLWEMRRIEK